MKKILVANRGEIALRVMRAAREMGIKTVAVYSAADRNALHVRYADEAVFIGAAPAAESYLAIGKIIGACRATGADAVHPGYGFLSENAVFARQVVDAGLIFIGPSVSAIEIMGNKLSAKALALKLGIPMVPGTDKAVTDVDEAKLIAIATGFPILIKAAAAAAEKACVLLKVRITLKSNCSWQYPKPPWLLATALFLSSVTWHLPNTLKYKY